MCGTEQNSRGHVAVTLAIFLLEVNFLGQESTQVGFFSVPHLLSLRSATG